MQAASRTTLNCHFDGGVGSRAKIGLVVLASDHTIEDEFRFLLDEPGVAIFHSRIEMAAAVTPQTLLAMRDRISDASALILPGTDMNVIAYGCTSASMVIGEEEVTKRLTLNHRDAATTTPITAARAALNALGARRIAVITPYRDDINARIRQYFSDHDFDVRAFASFEEEDDNKVACIAQECINAAVVDIGSRDDVDAVFVSCTNLRAAKQVAHLESLLGKPVTSSNHALAWHCRQLAGITQSRPEFGRLFECGQ